MPFPWSFYTTGSLDIFGRESTVDLNKPYVVFDIHGLGEQLKPCRFPGHHRYHPEPRHPQLETGASVPMCSSMSFM